MYFLNGIAYSGELSQSIKVTSVRPLDDYKLWIRFSTEEEKVFDFLPLLEFSCFKPLKDKSLFNSVYIDHGVTVWNDGEIDIAPEKLYENGVLLNGNEIISQYNIKY